MLVVSRGIVQMTDTRNGAYRMPEPLQLSALEHYMCLLRRPRYPEVTCRDPKRFKAKPKCTFSLVLRSRIFTSRFSINFCNNHGSQWWND